jgi:hypothetical protein
MGKNTEFLAGIKQRLAGGEIVNKIPYRLPDINLFGLVVSADKYYSDHNPVQFARISNLDYYLRDYMG